MLLTLRRAGHSRFYPPAIDLCICAFLRYTFSASHPTSSQNKVRVYWLNVRGVKITEQRLKAGCCWLSLPGWQRAAFTHTLGLWSPGSILPPFSPGSALTCLTLPNCNLSGSALLEQEDRGGRRGPAEYFDTAQLNRDWTKTTTVAQSRTDATIRQVEKETGGWGGEKKRLKLRARCSVYQKKKKSKFLLTALSIDDSWMHYTRPGVGCRGSAATSPPLKTRDGKRRAAHKVTKAVREKKEKANI